MASRNNQKFYQLKVTLKNAHRPIWRRIQVPGNINLLKLHNILQITMGWTNSHLHVFNINGIEYGDPANDEYDEFDIRDETNFKLNKVIHGKGQKFFYEYDFGDSWEHVLLVEKALTIEDSVHYPRCLAGKGACPPEDIGGVWGYIENSS